MAKPKTSVPSKVENMSTETWQNLLDVKEKRFDKELQRIESRLNKRIDEVKHDLKAEIERVQQNLQSRDSSLKAEIERVKKDLQQNLQSRDSSLKWFIGIFIAAGVTITGVIVTLIVALIK